MNNTKTYDPLDSLDARLITLQNSWENIGTISGLWSSVKEPLHELGCKAIAIYSPNTDIIYKHHTQVLRVFEIGDKPSISKVELSNSAPDIFAKLLKLSTQSSLSTIVSVPSEPLAELRDALPNCSTFDENEHAYVRRHHGPNFLTGYIFLTLTNDTVLKSIAKASLFALLLDAIYAKYVQINSSKDQQVNTITAREKQVLQLLVRGKTNNEIAINLGLSVHTVSAYVNVISLKLNTSTRTTTVLKGIMLGHVNI